MCFSKADFSDLLKELLKTESTSELQQILARFWYTKVNFLRKLQMIFRQFPKCTENGWKRSRFKGLKMSHCAAFHRCVREVTGSNPNPTLVDFFFQKSECSWSGYSIDLLWYFLFQISSVHAKSNFRPKIVCFCLKIGECPLSPLISAQCAAQRAAVHLTTMRSNSNQTWNLVWFSGLKTDICSSCKS